MLNVLELTQTYLRTVLQSLLQEQFVMYGRHLVSGKDLQRVSQLFMAWNSVSQNPLRGRRTRVIVGGAKPDHKVNNNNSYVLMFHVRFQKSC